MSIQRRTIARRAVIGIDQSYTGFALCFYYADGRYSMQRQAFTSDKSKGVDRLIEIGAWLGGVLAVPNLKIEHICMEDYARQRKQGREEAGELAAVVKLALRTSPMLRPPVCYPTVVAPTALKKFVTGKGTAAKSDMKLHCFKRWGVEFSSDDEADSYGLARMAAAIQWAELGLPGYQQDVLSNLRHHTEWQG